MKSRFRPIAVMLGTAILVAASPTRANAELGGTAASVSDDRVRMQGALLRISQTGPYALHEIRTATGTFVREFVSGGTVFGVAWEGPWQPNLRQLLGSYFDRYTQAVQNRRQDRRGRGPVVIRDGDLVVMMSGHPRAFSGRAYVIPLVPEGLDVSTIK